MDGSLAVSCRRICVCVYACIRTESVNHTRVHPPLSLPLSYITTGHRHCLHFCFFSLLFFILSFVGECEHDRRRVDRH